MINFKLRKLYRETSKQKKLHPEKFYFDDGRVCVSKDYTKSNIKYSVMKVNTDIEKNDYLVYILVISNHKPIPQMLLKKFSSNRGTTRYFNELCELIEKNTNQDIIDKCYEERFNNPNIFNSKKLSFVSRILS